MSQTQAEANESASETAGNGQNDRPATTPDESQTRSRQGQGQAQFDNVESIDHDARAKDSEMTEELIKNATPNSTFNGGQKNVDDKQHSSGSVLLVDNDNGDATGQLTTTSRIGKKLGSMLAMVKGNNSDEANSTSTKVKKIKSKRGGATSISPQANGKKTASLGKSKTVREQKNGPLRERNDKYYESVAISLLKNKNKSKSKSKSKIRSSNTGSNKKNSNSNNNSGSRLQSKRMKTPDQSQSPQEQGQGQAQGQQNSTLMDNKDKEEKNKDSNNENKDKDSKFVELVRGLKIADLEKEIKEDGETTSILVKFTDIEDILIEMTKDKTKSKTKTKEDIVTSVVDFTGISERKAKIFATRLLKEHPKPLNSMENSLFILKYIRMKMSDLFSFFV